MTQRRSRQTATAWELRLAFFRDGLDIGDWATLASIAQQVGLEPAALDAEIRSGRAHATLAADERDRQTHRVQGSPTFVLNEGRQVLFGNVGYRVLEANVRELLREPAAGAASWCCPPIGLQVRAHGVDISSKSIKNGYL